MFQLVGFILRLPFGLIWIAILFVSWPLGIMLFLGIFIACLLFAPLKYLACAFSGSKGEWMSWRDEFLNLGGLAESFTYPFEYSAGTFKWVMNG